MLKDENPTGPLIQTHYEIRRLSRLFGWGEQEHTQNHEWRRPGKPRILAPMILDRENSGECSHERISVRVFIRKRAWSIGIYAGQA
jgi:hypothetical protein